MGRRDISFQEHIVGATALARSNKFKKMSSQLWLQKYEPVFIQKKLDSHSPNFSPYLSSKTKDVKRLFQNI